MSDRSYVPNYRNVDTASGNVQPWLRLIENSDGSFSQAYADWGSSFLNIAGAATTAVKSGAGILIAITFNKLVASGVVTIYDNTAASGTKIGTVTNPAVLLTTQLNLSYGLRFATGLTIVTSAADDLTVIYR